MADFVMPSLGADMESGVLTRWCKSVGDSVKRGDIIAEVETDKGIIEVEVFSSGTIGELLVRPGTKVPVGTPLAVIREDELAVSPLEEPGPSSGDGSAHTPRASAEAPSFRLKMSPAARRLARELNIDPATISGTGPGGAITRDDLMSAGRATQTSAAAVAVPSRQPASPAARDATLQDDPQTRMRRAIAAAMARSKREIPHYYATHTIELGHTTAWLRLRNESRAVPDRLLISALFLKAVALALRDFPELNGRWLDERLVPNDRINVGPAIALRGGGLVAPALHDTDKLELEELMRRLRDLVERARRGQLRASEYSDATITVTSLGERGVDTVFPIIYPPQVAIVGFGSVVERPWVVEGCVGPRPLVSLSLAGDHRASDGHRGALFLRKIEQFLQEPEKL